jgi:hypothetical protein
MALFSKKFLAPLQHYSEYCDARGKPGTVNSRNFFETEILVLKRFLKKADGHLVGMALAVRISRMLAANSCRART